MRVLVEVSVLVSVVSYRRIGVCAGVQRGIDAKCLSICLHVEERAEQVSRGEWKEMGQGGCEGRGGGAERERQRMRCMYVGQKTDRDRDE